MEFGQWLYYAALGLAALVGFVIVKKVMSLLGKVIALALLAAAVYFAYLYFF
ncbi:hypothetical protein [Deinococcus soli (ex Cha et al. 2016)]|uniref:Uncharacterized membrane protein YebE (DUF533 family) n=2 Tax=Deinococcus soli (ex Cha et al. 2016) TaxID=1309411 RepID=A0AAE3XAT3_9DEIO|nr:hypothetical protein [Deinococcus soli (ex Cha et al. 2016)]MDR6218340.1 uncharacterized membrane protein YebE (DUF533 family) [Deinococcus soli (ex Cha et al. 2016)]MDR6329080.1 uncharacterized membrane protein YebE (DUF533 family) [Deinococcus soli (ex Cha et al. 2016)]MDR6751353.1 uncharacterized membrane protein YebE (DUF533 family) [Deinococcus soli (ex Cha et al. 2016)]